MSRDFAKNSYSKKTASYGKTRGASTNPPWLWLLAGIVVGLLIAAAFFFKESSLKSFASLKKENKSHKTHQSSNNKIQLTNKSEPQPQFDFYSILPKMTTAGTNEGNNTAAIHTKNTLQINNPPIIMPKSTSLQNNQPTKIVDPTLHKPKQQLTIPTHYILQVAAYKRFEDADKLKAELTLMGFNVVINPITVNKHTWNRVWVGPFQNRKAVSFARKQLAENRITGILIKERS